MAKVIDITSKMDINKASIKWGDRVYEVNNAFLTLLEMDKINFATLEGIEHLLNVTIGEDHGIDIKTLPVKNIKTLVIAITAAVQDLDFDEAASTFQVF